MFPFSFVGAVPKGPRCPQGGDERLGPESALRCTAAVRRSSVFCAETRAPQHRGRSRSEPRRGGSLADARALAFVGVTAAVSLQTVCGLLEGRLFPPHLCSVRTRISVFSSEL